MAAGIRSKIGFSANSSRQTFLHRQSIQPPGRNWLPRQGTPSKTDPAGVELLAARQDQHLTEFLRKWSLNFDKDNVIVVSAILCPLDNAYSYEHPVDLNNQTDYNIHRTIYTQQSMDEENTCTQTPLFYGVEEWKESPSIGFPFSDDGLDQNIIPEQQIHVSDYVCQDQQRKYLFSDYMSYDDLRFSLLYPPVQSGQIQEAGSKNNENPYSFSFASLELLKIRKNNGLNKLNRIIEPPISQELSTEEIMRIAGAKFLQFSCQTDQISASLYGLSDEDSRKVALAETLLASVEKIENKQFDSARRLLQQCDIFSSGESGNPVERVVYYFAEALRDRIDIETGKKTLNGMGKQQSLDIDDIMMTPNATTLVCHQVIPFCQISHFAGVQAIVDNVGEAKKIHIIDLVIRNGAQWSVLMQALISRRNCSVELLKITAIATHSKDVVENTGKRLNSFAQTMNIPFLFKIIMVSDFSELDENLIEKNDDETIAVFFQHLPRSLIAFPNRLDSMMNMIKNINPCVTVVVEIEANHNGPTFVNRFIETLFFYSAYFDCLDTFMQRDDENRMILESMYFGKGIKNILGTEGDERMVRNVKLDVWRVFFARFGMVETDLSCSSLFQANLIVERFECRNCCTLDKSGKSLILGWKGTPLHSLSAWKFTSEEN
ncbi:DELLA protein RGL1-like [Mercurialis annua]|uniref:DELLA protein RGL1-like n=1 Tax=Mercurialis annua TaxID=3986 RepID=UPI0021603CBD|nr:DELLA protein RGL1-like [Mercurialis annua]